MFPMQKAQVEQKLQDPQLYRRTKPGVNGISYEPEKMLEECRDKFLRLRKGGLSFWWPMKTGFFFKTFPL